MEPKQLFFFLIYCVLVNAQLISSMRKSTKIRKIKLPACGSQNPVGLQCGCANFVPKPTYNCGCANPGMCGCANPGMCGCANTGVCGCANPGMCGCANIGVCGCANPGMCGCANTEVCGCANPGMCGCPKYWDQMEIPSCSLELAGPFAMDIPYNLPPETCTCRSLITLPYDYLSPIEAIPLSSCGCQAARKPCGCQMSEIQPSNIYDFLSYMDIPYGCQNVVKLTNYEYVPCGCGNPQCGCQGPRDATVCGCHSGTIIPNYLPAIEPVTAVFPGLGVPYSCGCDGRCYMSDIPCGCQVSSNPKCTCQASACNCGCQRCGFGCGCGCGYASGCECGGKYLRQVTLQPPFL